MTKSIDAFAVFSEYIGFTCIFICVLNSNLDQKRLLNQTNKVKITNKTRVKKRKQNSVPHFISSKLKKHASCFLC